MMNLKKGGKVNKQEIDNFEGRELDLEGRELDLAVEKYVFGNTEPPIDGTDWLYRNDDGTWQGERCDFNRVWSIVEWPPEYHNSDYLAFLVVDKLIDTVVRFEHLTISYESGWSVEIYYRSLVARVVSESRPIAICRAALKVVCSD